jgi:DNA-binding SARP family transcriptional activator/tetratricopeptide (TPR) repeat protein
MRFQALGPLLVTVTDRPIAIKAAKPRAVLAMLLLRPNRPVPVDRIIDGVWGSEPPESATRLVQTYVWRLRGLLDEGDPDGPRIVAQPPGYLLRVRPGEFDVDEFAAHVTAGCERLVNDDPAQASELLGRALVLWRGEPFADAYLHGGHGADIARLVERHLVACEHRIEADLRMRRHDLVIDQLRTLTAAHPTRERFVEQLMLALDRCGRRAEALDAYHRARRALIDELGLEPGQRLQQIQRAILAGDTEPPSIDPTPATIATGVPVRQLPPDPADFTGRAEQLADLAERAVATSPAAPIHLISGPPGVGKTTFAVHLAHALSGRYTDGQIFVDLHGYDQTRLDAASALARVLQALNVPVERIPVEVDVAAGMYRSIVADRSFLIVLDNASHEDQIRSLLPSSPGCLALITTRDRLHLAGAHTLMLDLMTDVEAGELFARVAGSDRAAAEPTAVAEVSRLCGGLPLAVRIAAARLAARPAWTVAHLLERLRDQSRRLGELETGDAAVRTVFELSYRSLRPRTRLVFRRTGLHPGTELTAETAALLAEVGTASAADELEVLVDANLLAMTRDPRRYRLHDLLRLYARGCCEKEDSPATRTAARDRLLAWYLQTLDGAADRLYPHVIRLPRDTGPASAVTAAFGDDDTTRDWLSAEHGNLLATVRACADDDIPAALLIADRLRGAFYASRNVPDWIAVAEAGLTVAVRTGDRQAEAAMRNSLGLAHWSTSNFVTAVDQYRQGLAAARECGWRLGEAAILGGLGTVYHQQGRRQTAIDHYRQVLDINRELGVPRSMAAHLGNLGVLYREIGQLDAALHHFTEALATYRRHGPLAGEAAALGNLGQTYRDLGHLDQAEDHLTRALTAHRATGYRNGQAIGMVSLADVENDRGNHEHALIGASAALELAEEIGDGTIRVDCHNTIGAAHLGAGRPDRAADQHHRAAELALDLGYVYGHIAADLGLAAVARNLGDDDSVQAYAEAAHARASEGGFAPYIAAALAHLESFSRSR